MKTIRNLPFIIVVLLTISCGGSNSDIPEMPVVSTQEMRKVAREQIDEAYAAAKHRPADISSVANLAYVLHAYEFFDAAEVAYRRALAIRPEEPRLVYLRAVVLQNLGRLDEALTQFYSMEPSGELGDLAQARIATIQSVNGDWHGALATANDALRLYSGHPELQFLRGQALLELGEAKTADRVFRELFDAGVRHPSLYYAAGRAASALGDKELAQTRFSEFERMRAGGSGWPDKVVRAVNAKRLTARSKVEASRRALARGGSTEEAIQTLEEAIQIDPEAYEAHITLIGLYGARSQFSLAEPHIRRAMELAPNVAQLHFNVGTVRNRQNRNADAIAAFSRAVELEPTHAWSLAFLGELRYEDGEISEAISSFERALGFAPQDAIVREKYTSVLMQLSRFDRALEILDYAHPQPSGEARRQLQRAQALQLSGNVEGAREALIQAEEVAKKSKDPLLRRRIDSALRQLENGDG